MIEVQCGECGAMIALYGVEDVAGALNVDLTTVRRRAAKLAMRMVSGQYVFTADDIEAMRTMPGTRRRRSKKIHDCEG